MCIFLQASSTFSFKYFHWAFKYNASLKWILHTHISRISKNGGTIFKSGPPLKILRIWIGYDSRMRASERQHEIEPKNIKNKTNSKSNQNLVEVHWANEQKKTPQQQQQLDLYTRKII